MSFEAAWGFDPDKAAQANGFAQSKIETNESTYSAEGSELREYRPICKRRFMSSGECIASDAIVDNSAAGPPTYSPGRPFNEWPLPSKLFLRLA